MVSDSNERIIFVPTTRLRREQVLPFSETAEWKLKTMNLNASASGQESHNCPPASPLSLVPTHIRLLHVPLLLLLYAVFLLLIVSTISAQTAARLVPRYPTTSTSYPLAQTARNQAPISSATSDSHTSPSPIQQPKSLKFTLIAGKYWKFNIKTNSLQTSHREKELRLHKNVSANNFIIDDDGWFQYNHQQQQLFAWPSLSVKPATYHFVLLPSGLDFEADGEIVVNSLDVVANIVVELIRPLHPLAKFDVDQLIDHKFSLDYLHRLSSYPLLVSQIVSVLDQVFRNNSIQFQDTSSTAAATTTDQRTTTSSLLSLIHTNKQLRSTNRLSEYLLIDSSYSEDGEIFSLTWTTLPSLINNTIALITECRLTNINDTVTKLSSPSLGYQNESQKFVIYYSLEASALNSQAIVPTERGNYALRLSLNGPCRSSKVIEELAIPITSNLYNGLAADGDEKENNIFDRQISSTAAPFPFELGSTKPTSGPAKLTKSGNSDTTATEVTTIESNAAQPSDLAPTTTTTATNSSPDRAISSPGTPQEHSQLLTQSLAAKTSDDSTTTTPALKTAPAEPKPEPELEVGQAADTTTRALTSSTSARDAIEVQQPALASDQPAPSKPPLEQAPPDEREQQPQQQQQPQTKIPPQIKSFANFLDLPIEQIETFMSNTTTSTPASSGGQIGNSIAMAAKDNATTNYVPSVSSQTKPETSLNEDLIGVVNEVVDYLVSIAIPLAVIIGTILLTSIIIALCSLRRKRRKSKEYEVGDRFKFRYGSERRGFLKNSSRPVILEADQKSLSMGGTPMHKAVVTNKNKTNYDEDLKKKSYNSDGKKGRRSHGGSQDGPTTGNGFFDMNVFASGRSSVGDCEGGSSGGDRGGGGGGR